MSTYNVTLTYSKPLGRASLKWENDQVRLKAVTKPISQFLGWYVNSILISQELEVLYTPVNDCAIEGRFEKIYEVDASTNGNGSITVTRGTNKNDIVITVIPIAHYHFSKYIVNGFEVSDFDITSVDNELINTQDNKILSASSPIETEIYEARISAHLSRDVTVKAIIEEDEKYRISASGSYMYTTVYVSDDYVYDGTQVTLWARPFPGYEFVNWTDDTYDNPKVITVHSDIVIIANYVKTSDDRSVYQYRCYIKDRQHLTDPPKAFMIADEFRVAGDLMTKSSSTITVINPPNNIYNGDILVLYDPKGDTLFSGVITSINSLNEEDEKKEDAVVLKEITCGQMQSIYSGNWVYEKGETPPENYNGNWVWKRYSKSDSAYPKITEFDNVDPIETRTFSDASVGPDFSPSTNYTAIATIYIWCSNPFKAELIINVKDAATVYLNETQLTEMSGSGSINVGFIKGCNTLTICYTAGTESNGWSVRCQQQSGEVRISELPKVLGITSDKTTTYIEQSVYNIINNYSSGKIVGSDYIDPLIAQSFAGIQVSYSGNTANTLPTYNIGETMDLEEFIYYLYDKYNIVFEFDIRFSGTSYVTIKNPSYDPISVGNNLYAVQDMLPETKIEETNRLIVFDSNNNYRTTVIATEDGRIIDTSQSSGEITDRFKMTKTAIVSTDDSIKDVIASNLPEQMMNHKIEFTLLLKNFIYEYSEFKLGGGIHIYYYDDYYDSVYTGFEIEKEPNTNINSVRIICGKVRKKLTQLLTLKKV